MSVSSDNVNTLHVLVSVRIIWVGLLVDNYILD